MGGRLRLAQPTRSSSAASSSVQQLLHRRHAQWRNGTLAVHPGGSEVEPLEESLSALGLARWVAADGQLDVGRVGRVHHLDVPAVEIRVDRHRRPSRRRRAGAGGGGGRGRWWRVEVGTEVAEPAGGAAAQAGHDGADGDRVGPPSRRRARLHDDEGSGSRGRVFKTIIN